MVHGVPGIGKTALLDYAQYAATQIAGGLGLLRAGPVPGRIEQSFLNRIKELPDETRLLLLIAAAEPVGDPALVWRAADRLGVTPATALAEGTDGLLSIQERVTFRYPLVRSAVYQSAEPRHRRAVHLALAEVTDETTDPDRRAWHLASAAAGPDEAVAAELERSAGRARARGGLAAAAAFLPAAVGATDDRPHQDFHRAEIARQEHEPAFGGVDQRADRRRTRLPVQDSNPARRVESETSIHAHAQV